MEFLLEKLKYQTCISDVREENGSSVAQEVPDQPDDGEVDWLKKLSDFAG
jgi:hypothetical protein